MAWHHRGYRGGSYYGNPRLARGLLRFKRFGSAGCAHSAPVITHPRGRMPVVERSQTATAAPAPVELTTQEPGRPPRPCKGPTPMGTMELRRFQKTVTPAYGQHQTNPKERQLRHTLRTAVRHMARRVSTAIAQRWVRLPTATNMRLRTGTPTRTPGAVGAEIRTIRTKAHQAGEGRKRVADHPHSAEAVGNPDRQVRAVQQAEAPAVDKSEPPICPRK